VVVMVVVVMVVVLVVVVGAADFLKYFSRTNVCTGNSVQLLVNGVDSTKQIVRATRATIPALTGIIHFMSRMQGVINLISTRSLRYITELISVCACLDTPLN
jgi:hypothetical protein